MSPTARVTQDRIALVAIALVTVHVLDDSFVQPSSGVSAADHLVGGALSTVFLLLAAAVLRVSRDGLRAVTAGIVGVCGLVGGVELAVAVQGAGDVSGDDYTGALSVLGGALLLALSVWIAWTRRKTTGSLVRRTARRCFVGTVAFLGTFLVVVPIAIAYITTHTVGQGLMAAPDIGVPVVRAPLSTTDGLQLSAWYSTSRNGAAVIVVPGRSGLAHARMLANHGYGVLLLNRRGEADSGGDPNSLGWGGHPDVAAAVDYLRGRPDVRPGAIGALGLSVGGEISLEAAARNPGLRAVVAEGAGARSLRETMETAPALRSQLLVLGAVLTAAVTVFADQAQPANLLSLVERIIGTSVLVIWAEHGEEPELELGRRYAAATPGALSWEVPGASHIGGLRAQPREYERRVVGFFDDALLAAGREASVATSQ